MTGKVCTLVGIPVQDGAGRMGCEMGPSALRTAGLAEAVRGLGFALHDRGDLRPGPAPAISHPNPAIRRLPEIAAWIAVITEAAYAASAEGVALFLGGDHSLSAGTVAGVARRAAEVGRPLFLLWLDAHPDFHTLASTASGNLHGVPMAYVTGREGFEGYFPPLPVAVPPERVAVMGARSVDPAERAALARAGVTVFDMRTIDEQGVKPLLVEFLARVRAAGGMVHVSLDVDFLEPAIAPAVGTTVPGGATFREAHLVMEMLHDSGLVCSLDVVELNPFLDERGRSATLLVDLVASLLGRAVMDRPTRSFG